MFAIRAITVALVAAAALVTGAIAASASSDNTPWGSPTTVTTASPDNTPWG